MVETRQLDDVLSATEPLVPDVERDTLFGKHLARLFREGSQQLGGWRLGFLALGVVLVDIQKRHFEQFVWGLLVAWKEQSKGWVFAGARQCEIGEAAMR